MKSYISDMEGKFHSGDLSIANYSLNSVQGISAYSSILDSVYNQSNAAAGNGDNTVTSNKQKPNIQAESQSAVYLDPTAPFDSTADLYSRGTETIAFTSTANNVRKGLAIDKISGREIKYKVNNPHLIGINSSNKGRNYKTYSKSYIDAELNRGNTPKVSQYVNAGSGATQALKSKAGWLGIGYTTVSNISTNMEDGEEFSTIVTDAGIDVAIGAATLAVGGAAAAFVVGTLGATVGAAAVASLGVSIGATYLFDGLKINGQSISEGIKQGVEEIGDGIKKGLDTVAGWFS